MSALNSSLCEVPLCTLATIDFLEIQSSLTLAQAVSNTRAYNLNIASLIGLSQDESAEVSWGVSSNLVLSHQLDCLAVYNAALSSSLNLSQDNENTGVYNNAVNTSLQLVQELEAYNVYYISICDYIPLIQKLANVIEISIESVLNLNLEERDGLESVIALAQAITTNMDNLDCSAPYGRNGDKSISSILNLTQSVSVNMVYAANLAQSLNIQNTVAWR